MNTPSATATIPQWFADDRRRLAEGLARIKASVDEIATIYVQAIDRDPAFRDYIADEVVGVPANFWRSLEMVGRKQLDGRILTGVPFGNKLRSLPMSEQRAVLDGSLSLLVRDGDSLQVKLDAITMDQAEQLFARDHIRSLAEQRTWLESRSTIKRMQADHTAPVVELDKKRREIVIGNVRITASEMAEYLRKLME
jgi:hypothetical protein